MMIVQMDNTSAPSSRERAQLLYEKNIELENKRRRSAQARIPSDPNAWPQMRENYEAIVLEDHGFSEQNNIEYALWQLHYRRIEELRTHFNTALASAKSNTSQSAKVSPQPDRVTKIRLQFKTFLSEATGFYHDLILKVKAKYGLPLGCFSEDSDDQAVLDKDGKKSAAVKRGLISWHRCLIYLGDLARYKGLYGEGDSKNREYSAASSYYLQAASLWPSSGNPHHQLAILASYSGDELVTVYRYFRSLAVDNPFMTARDNLIVAFEKNRQSYTQLLGNAKVPIKDSSVPPTSKGRGKRELKAAAKDTNLVVNVNNEKTSDIHDVYKSFCVRFVRLNGILFTRTSLETFDEVLSSVSCEFCDLLSSGPDEELNFGLDTAENALFIVRLISILIYTVYNVKRESEGQSYAEIVQRTVLLQNAFTAVFELMGCMLERIVQLRDPSLSYLLPGILVFMEWLACCPEVASGTDADDKQAAVGMKFWNHCTSFLNKILSFLSMSLDDNEDDMCFNNMSRYEEGETGNRLALWEDFELRGFLPIVAAQSILDFSKKHSFGSDGSKEKNARVKRILAAGKSLVNVVRIEQKTFLYDSRMKKFVIGLESRVLNDDALTFDFGCPKSNDLTLCAQPKQAVSTDVLLPSMQPFTEGDEDDEVIVFRPAVTEKQNDELSPKWTPSNGVKPLQDFCAGDIEAYAGHISAPLDLRQQAAFDPGSQISLSVGSGASKNQLPIQPDTSKWLVEDVFSLANSLKAARFMENGHASERGFHNNSGISSPPIHAVPVRQPTNVNSSGLFYNQTKFLEPVAPTNDVITSGVLSANPDMKTSATLPAGTRKSPVSRPARHSGPPPGFSHVPSSQLGEPVTGSDRFNENSVIDDYSWLDGYQLPTLTKGYGLGGATNVTSQAMPQYIHNNSGLTGTASFPFPGKQVTSMPFQTGKQNGWQNYQALEHLRIQKEQQLQQQLVNGNHQSNSMSEQYYGNSIWNNHYIV